jgi:uncharacterized protein
VTDRVHTSTQIDLRIITAPEIPLRRTFAPAELGPASDDFRLLGDVTFDGILRKKDQRFQLKGHVKAPLELTCGRCAEAFAWPIDVDVDLTYVPEPTASADPDEVELNDEDLTTAYFRDQTLDLGEMLREQFYLAMPMRPLCSEDCKGLCPHCGTNLNNATCDCDVRWQDPRLAGLQSLLKNPDPPGPEGKR